MSGEMQDLNLGRPGRLFYVMGPSGAGKDTLMAFARESLCEAPVIFAHRYITRPIELHGENHIHLSEAEFANRLQRGCFKFHWNSHGWLYGLGTEVDTWLNQGLNVVMNGSRGYFEQACQLHPHLVAVLVTASESTLRERLMARGRESAAEIEERISRASEFESLAATHLHRINNEGSIEAGGKALIKVFSEQEG